MPEACVDPNEALVIEKTDANGARWVKKYVGGGTHFDNWLEQYLEVFGEENVMIEEIAAPTSSCYMRVLEKLFRIWVRERK